MQIAGRCHLQVEVADVEGQEWHQDDNVDVFFVTPCRGEEHPRTGAAGMQDAVPSLLVDVDVLVTG